MGTRARTRYRYAAAALAAALTLGLTACQPQESAGPEVGTDVDDITNELGALQEGEVAELTTFIGEQVTLSGEVSQVYTDNAFRLAAEVDGGVLVVSAGDVDLDEGAVVQVTGTVRRIDQGEFADEFGLRFDEGPFSDLEDQIAVVAETIDETAPTELPDQGDVGND